MRFFDNQGQRILPFEGMRAGARNRRTLLLMQRQREASRRRRIFEDNRHYIDNIPPFNLTTDREFIQRVWGV